MWRRWHLPIIAGLLLIPLWAFLVYVSLATKQRQLEDSQKELAQLNNTVAQHAAGLFRDVTSSLLVIDHWLQANPDIDPRTDARFVAMVADLRLISQGVIDPRMVTTDGGLFYIPSPDAAPLANVSDREYFKSTLSSREQKLHIGDPVQSRVTKMWGIPISWRLTAPVSDVIVIFASIDLLRLSAMHDQMRLKPNGSITLIRTDGMVLAHTPYLEASIGQNVKDEPIFQQEYGVKPSGSYISDGKDSDGIARLVSYQRLEGFPVTTLVHRDLKSVLAPYEERRLTVFIGAVLLTLLALMFVRMARRSQLALQLSQDRLELLEATDSMTGVTSRRAFMELAERECSRARRYMHPLAILMLDIDHFKQVNDRHGHPAGDMVLRDCASAWKAVLREQDLLGRVGGEEFCVLLPETAIDSARHAAERLREAVSHLKFSSAKGEFSVTVSIGLTMFLSSDTGLAASLERADRALYRAKEQSRNRVETVTNGHSTPHDNAGKA